MANGKTRLFIKQMLCEPGATGAIVPSSRRLARKMLEMASPAPGAVIAEYGPGTGSFTRAIMDSLAPGQTFFCVETNENFARALRRDLPRLSLHVGCASGIAGYCARENVDRVDCVISGLPWAVFPGELQKRILDAMMAVMPKGGVFVTFAYVHGLALPAGRRFRRNLESYFSTVGRSGVVWGNIPPAIVYRAVR